MTRFIVGRPILRAFATLALTAAAGAAAAQDIPAAMRGTWAEEANLCTTPESDGRIAVRAREVQFFASDCRVKRLRNLGNGGWRADVACEDEGEHNDGVIELRLVAGGRLSLKLDSNATQTLLRCAGNPRVR